MQKYTQLTCEQRYHKKNMITKMVMNYFTSSQCFIKGLCINICNHAFPMLVLRNEANIFVLVSDAIVEEFKKRELFSDPERILELVGNNIPRLRKLSQVQKSGYYKDENFLQRLLYKHM
jgi:hypothetical protein